MKTKFFAAAVLNFACASTLTLSAGAAPLPAATSAAPPVRVTGPINSGNLSVYLIHGKDKLPGKKILTLQEALASGKIVVNETGDVNQLSVQNNSDQLVFIQSGDIVKGGRQDRTMQYDLLLPPKSGVIPLPAFCVEHGRWSGRGGESAAKFSTSANALASKELKIAAKNQGDQSSVWQNVSQMQTKLSAKSGYLASQTASPTSFELTLEDKKVRDAAASHVKDLAKVIDGQSDVIGYGFAINGKINSADVYASHDLFVKLWPKLLDASAVEAVADQEAGKQYTAPKPAEITDLFAQANKQPAKRKMASAGSVMTEQSSGKAYLYKASYKGPALQGATNGSVGPQGADATVIHENILTNY